MQCKSPWKYYPLKPSGKAPKQINNGGFFWLIFPWSRLVETPKNSSAYQYIGPHCLQIITYESVVWGCLGGQWQIMPFSVPLYVNTLMFISLLTVILFVCLSACLCFYSLSVYIWSEYDYRCKSEYLWSSVEAQPLSVVQHQTESWCFVSRFQFPLVRADYISSECCNRCRTTALSHD